MTNQKRLHAIILEFLGCPYLIGPCGEGPAGRFDQRPICRDDAFDCLTYVNFVLAHYLSSRPEDVLANLKRINYSSDEISYFTRCHYMTADWLPHNIRAKRLAWVTSELGFVVHTVTRDFNRGWFFQQRTKADLCLIEPLSEEQQDARVRELKSGGPTGVVPISITYIDWIELKNNIRNLQENLPPISIMLVVRPGDAYVQTCGMVTHLGFVLNETNKLYFVHAKHQVSVQKEKLSDYFDRFSDSPSIKGASFLRVCGNDGRNDSQ